jgi:predicted nucleic acid-binding protein
MKMLSNICQSFHQAKSSPEDALNVLANLTYFIHIVDSSVYSLYEVEAKQRIAVRDINDWSIVAASLLLDRPIWTEGNYFFGCDVATWTSDRIRLYLSQ